MIVEPLTLQAYLNGNWQDIATLSFTENYLPADLTYLYQDTNVLLQDNQLALSLNYPITLFGYSYNPANGRAFRFLDDITPAGASRRYWLKALNIEHLPVAEQNYILLKRGTIAPIGHLRIKQAVESLPKNEKLRLFSIDEVKNRSTDFLEYANQRGAMVGGATGAGGEAPKLVLRCTKENQIWIDNWQNKTDNSDYYLVKFPRGKRTGIDADILRTEYHYYHELTALGFNTIATDIMRLEEGEYYPSLWLPRFDIYRDKQNTIQRYAMESVYSILEQGAGSMLDQAQTVRTLIQKIEHSHMACLGFAFNRQAFITEWLQRDLLNIAFGNSDNHGRNTAFLRTENEIKLAPIYDFAPMKADPEGIIRTISWNSKSNPPLELGGEYHFKLICEQFADLCDVENIFAELQKTAQKLVDLKTRLAERGVPKSILEFRSIGFDYLPEKLARWGLI